MSNASGCNKVSVTLTSTVDVGIVLGDPKCNVASVVIIRMMPHTTAVRRDGRTSHTWVGVDIAGSTKAVSKVEITAFEVITLLVEVCVLGSRMDRVVVMAPKGLRKYTGIGVGRPLRSNNGL